MSGAKNKIMILYKTKRTQDYGKPTGVKKVYGGGRKPKILKNTKIIEDKN